MAQRHPFVEKLARLHKQRKSMSGAQLESFLFEVQDELEELWETGEILRLVGPEAARTRTCARESCNNSRYPAPNANFCLLHSQGNDSFAASYRRAKALDNKS
jgi:hypothetical protein